MNEDGKRPKIVEEEEKAAQTSDINTDCQINANNQIDVNHQTNTDAQHNGGRPTIVKGTKVRMNHPRVAILMNERVDTVPVIRFMCLFRAMAFQARGT